MCKIHNYNIANVSHYLVSAGNDFLVCFWEYEVTSYHSPSYSFEVEAHTIFFKLSWQPVSARDHFLSPSTVVPGIYEGDLAHLVTWMLGSELGSSWFLQQVLLATEHLSRPNHFFTEEKFVAWSYISEAEQLPSIQGPEFSLQHGRKEQRKAYQLIIHGNKDTSTLWCVLQTCKVTPPHWLLIAFL